VRRLTVAHRVAHKGKTMDYRAADLTLRNAKPKATSYEIPLGGGLSARIAADGSAKTIYWRGKKDGRVIRVKLGHYPDMTIRQAADAALKVHSSVRNGVDPNLKARREAAGTGAPVTVREAAERFAAEHLDVKSGTRWRHEARRLLKVNIVPEIGSSRLSDIARTDLTSLVDKKAAALRKQGQSGVIANRLVAVLAKLFGYCVDKGWLAASPAIRLPKPVVEVKRDRVLSPVELGDAWIALQDAQRDGSMPLPYARVLALLMLTGARASEITSLRRRAVDLDGGSLTIEAGKTAASKRVLTLPATARALLASTIESMDTDAPDALLFLMPRARHEIPSLDISKAARVLVGRLGHARWTPHDLRRTLITGLHELGVDGDVARRVAGHVGPDIHASVYDQSRQLDKVRDALAAYEGFVLNCVAKVGKSSESNVVALRAG
jgi:integrase